MQRNVVASLITFAWRGHIMRFFFIAPLLFLTGCAGLTEQLLNSQTASDRLRAQLGADIDLQGALRRDIARKNAELEFITYGTYSCGPDNADYQKVRIYSDITPAIAREQAVIIAAVKQEAGGSLAPNTRSSKPSSLTANFSLRIDKRPGRAAQNVREFKKANWHVQRFRAKRVCLGSKVSKRRRRFRAKRR